MIRSIVIAMVAHLMLVNSLVASPFTAWKEFPSDPIYTPYPVNEIEDDYFPCVIYNANKFDGNGAAFFYKMWHQGPTGAALSYSNDGIHWKLVGDVVSDPTIAPNVPLHAKVLYDKKGFGGTAYHYKMWYWTGNSGVTTSILNIKFTQSPDGVTWTTPVDTTQDTTYFLVDSNQPGQAFYHMYGFGQMLYNPQATSTAGNPFSFPYVTFFDSSAEEIAPQTTAEAIALAYSTDGLHWIRYGSEPVLIPAGNDIEWDGRYAYEATVIKLNGVYHMFYSGSNNINNPDPGFIYTFGIGHASSTDGINWTKDPDNPIFTILDPNEGWRSGRTLVPTVVIGKNCIDTCGVQSVLLQMWFSGGINIPNAVHNGPSFENGFLTASIGYATLSLKFPTCERMWLRKKKCRR